MDVEGRHLVGPRPPPGAELETPIGEVVENGHLFRAAHGMVDPGAEVEDPRTDMDALGHSCQVARHDLVGRQMAVLGERMVLGEPDELPVVAVGALGELDLVREGFVLLFGIMTRRPGQVTLDEDGEFHGTPFVRGWVGADG